jgi:hypothetical protein
MIPPSTAPFETVPTKSKPYRNVHHERGRSSRETRSWQARRPFELHHKNRLQLPSAYASACVDNSPFSIIVLRRPQLIMRQSTAIARLLGVANSQAAVAAVAITSLWRTLWESRATGPIKESAPGSSPAHRREWSAVGEVHRLHCGSIHDDSGRSSAIYEDAHRACRGR